MGLILKGPSIPRGFSPPFSTMKNMGIFNLPKDFQHLLRRRLNLHLPLPITDAKNYLKRNVTAVPLRDGRWEKNGRFGKILRGDGWKCNINYHFTIFYVESRSMNL